MELDRLLVPVLPDMDRFGPTLNRGVDRAARTAGGNAGKGFSSGFKAGPVAAGVLIADVLRKAAQGAVNFFKDGWAEAEEAKKVTAQTAAVIKSTGGAANVTSSQVDALSTALMKQTKVDDELITAGQNMLLTFTEVQNRQGKGNDIFTQATKVAQDLSKATGKDLVGSNVMLGKALNDPTRGMSALRRVGVSFTKQQEDQIKTMQRSGDITGAQKIILAELTKEFGGSAKAQATASDAFKVWYGNVKEAAGAGLQRTFQAIQKPIAAIGKIGAAVFQGLSRDIGGSKGVFETFAQFLETHQADIISGFVEGGKAVFGVLEAFLRLGSGGLRVIGTLDQGVSNLVDKFIDSAGAMLRNAAKATAWIPGLGPKLAKSSEEFDTWAEGAKKANDKQGEGALAAADKFDTWADSAKNARERTAKLGEEAVWKAEQADAAKRASIAIEDIGKKGDVSRQKLSANTAQMAKGSKAQREFAERVNAARDRLVEQYRQGERTGVGQKELTKRWDAGREALRREFIQMGFTKEEANRLTAAYKKVPKKAETKVTQPGMGGDIGALARTKRLDEYVNALNDKGVAINFKTNAAEVLRAYNIRISNKGTTGAQGGNPVGGPSGAPHQDPMGPSWGGPTVTRTISTKAKGSIPGREGVRAYDDLGDKIADQVGEKVGSNVWRAVQKRIEADGGAPGGSVGTKRVGAGWGPIQAAMRRHGATTFNTYPGHHPSMSRARDVYPHNWAAANAARALSSVWYVIYRMRIASKNHGNIWRPYHPTNFRGDWRHNRHIHVARYDAGGLLPPGATLALNQTGQSEVMRPTFLHKTRAGHQRGRDEGHRTGRDPIHLTLVLDLGDGIQTRVQGIVDENDEFKAAVGRSRG